MFIFDTRIYKIARMRNSHCELSIKAFNRLFQHNSILQISNSKKYSKVSLYEKMLPSVVVVAVLLNEK